MDDQETMRFNLELAQRINREALADPSSSYAGKFIGIVGGEVVVVADDLRSVSRRLREIEPDNRRVFWIEASRDYSRIITCA
jgi:hypothetical protein